MSVDEFEKSILRKKEIGNNKGVAKDFALLAKNFANAKNYNKALEYLTKSQEIRLKINDKSGMIKNYLGMAKIYGFLEQKEKAIHSIYEGINIISQMKEETGYYHSLTYDLYLLKERFENV